MLWLSLAVAPLQSPHCRRAVVRPSSDGSPQPGRHAGRSATYEADARGHTLTRYPRIVSPQFDIVIRLTLALTRYPRIVSSHAAPQAGCLCDLPGGGRAAAPALRGVSDAAPGNPQDKLAGRTSPQPASLHPPPEALARPPGSRPKQALAHTRAIRFITVHGIALRRNPASG